MKQDAFKSDDIPVQVPDLGAGETPLGFVTWLVPRNARVIPGERIAELLAQGIVFLLESPAEGRLVRQIARAGEAVHCGDVIALIRPAPGGES